MVSIKGFYEWKLIDKDTGEVVQKGSQWNLCTDFFLYWFLYGSTNAYPWYYATMMIQLSDTAPTPGVDYRRSRLSSGSFNLLEQGTYGGGCDFTLRSKWDSYNFSPPGSPRTIRTIGAGFSTNPNRFLSFIELSTPITQQINQYLYVKYTNFFNYVMGGYNTPNNHYIEYGINSMILKGGERKFDGSPDKSDTVQPILTVFIPPTDVNKLMRYPEDSFRNYMVGTTSGTYAGGAEHAFEFLRNYAVSDLIGPIGAMAFGANPAWNQAVGGGWMSQTYGYSEITDLAPSISRVFVHPESRITRIFSDPSYPASSQGGIVLSGTPTNKYAIVGRVKITKTGDASDIVDETFTADAGTNELTVSQTWALNDIARFTTTDTLPAPLATGTDYYLLASGSVFKVSLSQSGPEVDITDTGIGTHTIIRQNTGRYVIECQPWTWPNVYASTPNWLAAGQLPMGLDVDGKSMPQYLESIYDTGEGGVSYATDPSYMLRGQAQIGNYIYTVQKSRVSGVHNVCRWPLMSLETSEALCKFATSALVVNEVIADGVYLYIATATGIYKYDSTTPTVAPSLLTITGIIDNDVRDLTKDTVSGYFWSGHSTGLSKIDMGALTATQYLRGTGEALDGLGVNDVNIQRGQLSAYNGRVLKNGHPTVWTSLEGQYKRGWVMDDGTGWIDFTVTGAPNNVLTGCIRKGTNQVFIHVSNTSYELSVAITGKGTGTVTILRSWSTGFWSGNDNLTPIVQINDDTFVYAWAGRYCYTHQWGTSSDTYLVLSTSMILTRDTPSFRNKIDLGDGIYILLWSLTFYFQNEGYSTKFGYTGGNWIIDDTTERNIPKTATHTLLHGVSVDFNNAVGKDWDEQFIATERFTFVYGPGKIKDNLQTMQWKARYYGCEAALASGVAVSVPGSTPYTYHITQQSDPDFRDMDATDYAIEVKEGVTEYTKYTVTMSAAISVDYGTDIITCGLNIATGTPVRVECNYGTYYPIYPLRNFGVYYAINVDATRCKLANTYAEALAGTAVDLVSSPAQTNSTYIGKAEPTTGTYVAGSNGVFVFSSVDTGKNLTLKYIYTSYS